MSGSVLTALHRNYLVDDPLELGQIGLLEPEFVISLGRPPVHRLGIHIGRADRLCPLDKTGEASEVSCIECRIYSNQKVNPAGRGCPRQGRVNLYLGREKQNSWPL
jgi:hypothetical protein